MNRGTLAAYNSHPLNYQVCNKILVKPNQRDDHLSGRLQKNEIGPAGNFITERADFI